MLLPRNRGILGDQVECLETCISRATHFCRPCGASPNAYFGRRCHSIAPDCIRCKFRLPHAHSSSSSVHKNTHPFYVTIKGLKVRRHLYKHLLHPHSLRLSDPLPSRSRPKQGCPDPFKETKFFRFFKVESMKRILTQMEVGLVNSSCLDTSKTHENEILLKWKLEFSYRIQFRNLYSAPSR